MSFDEAVDITFTDYFFKSVGKYADLVALIDPDRLESITFGELRIRTSLCIRALEEIGVHKGDRIGSFVGNSPEFLVFCLAANQIGAVISPLNPAFKIGEFEHYFAQVEAQWVLTEVAYVEKLKKSAKLMQQITSLLVLPAVDEKREEEDQRIRLLQTSRPKTTENLSWHENLVHAEDDAMIFFSSGTTGPPKGVILSQRSLTSHIAIAKHLQRSADSDFITLANRDTVYGVLPFFHAGGLLTAFIMLVQGAKVLINRRFDEELFLQNINLYQVTVINVVPPILEFLAHSPKVDPSKLTSLKYAYVGAAKVRLSLEAAVCSRLPNIEQVLQLYGLTEAGVLVFMMPSRTKTKYLTSKTGSCGLALPGVQARVLPTPSLEYSPNFEYGELLLRTTTQMSNYLNAKDLPDIFDEEGFLHTGDLVKVDADGFYYIVGRLKELIKVRGWQVSPYELEEAIRRRFPAVVDIAVVGVGHSRDGEQPAAVIVLAPGTMLSAGEIEHFVEDNFVSYKKLTAGVHFVDSLPKTASGKMDRPMVVKMLGESD